MRISARGARRLALVEDVSLGIDALNGFPGPYCKPMLEAIAPEGLWDLMSRYDDRRATVTCTLGVMDLKCAAENIFEPSRAPWFLRPRTSSTARRVGIASFNRMDFQKRSGSSSSRNRLKFRIVFNCVGKIYRGKLFASCLGHACTL